MVRPLFFAIFVLTISIIDAKTFKIPDFLLFLGFVTLLICDVYRFSGISQFPERIVAGCIWLSLFYLVYQYSGGLGFGDVKYAGLIGYFLGLEKSFAAFLCTALIAAMVYVVGLVLLGWKKTAKLPFAPFLSFGALAAEYLKIGMGK